METFALLGDFSMGLLKLVLVGEGRIELSSRVLTLVLVLETEKYTDLN